MKKERKKEERVYSLEEEVRLNVEFQKAHFTDFQTCYEKSRLLRECTDPSLPGFDGQHGLCPMCGGWDGSYITRWRECAVCDIHRIFWDWCSSSDYPEKYEGEFKKHADYLRAFWYWDGEVLWPPYHPDVGKHLDELGKPGRKKLWLKECYESTGKELVNG